LLFRSIIRSEDYQGGLKQELKNLRQLQLLIINGDMDNRVKAGFDSRFQKMFPTSSSILTKGGSHFAVEETPDQASNQHNPLLVDASTDNTD
jgi:hypothetical protein